MKKLTQILDKILEAVLCIMIVFMVFGCVWQIITRFIIQDPSDWTEEFVRYTLIWTTMLLIVPVAIGMLNTPERISWVRLMLTAPTVFSAAANA